MVQTYSSQQGRSATMAQLLAPDHYKNARASKRGPLKDHARENVRLMREASQNAKEAREQASEVKPLYKMKQFDKVASRLNEPTKKQPPVEVLARSNSANSNQFLRRGAREEQPTPAMVHAKAQGKPAMGKIPSRRSSFDDDASLTPRKGACPARDDVLKVNPKRDVDLIARNRSKAVDAPSRHSAKQQVRPAKHDSFGRTPEYIDKRKQELRAEAEMKRRDAPDPDAPPGMVKMDDGERLDMLDVLRERQKALQADHFKLPLNISTQRHKNKKADIEAALTDVERSIGIFDRPVVYVQA